MAKMVFRFLVMNYLKVLTKIKLSFYKGTIIGVAGCYGKSSAVSIIEQALSQSSSVFSSTQKGKGLNSETGIPFAILGVKPDTYTIFDWFLYCAEAFAGVFSPLPYEYMVLELGVDKPGDMRFLTTFIKPDISILLNSNNTHSANFELLHARSKKSYEELISYENGYIFEAAEKLILYNLDDPEVVRQTSRSQKNKIAFSTTRDTQIITFVPTLEGNTILQYRYRNQVFEIALPYPLLDEYKNTLELLFKLAEFLEIPEKDIQNTLEHYELPAGRCTYFHGIKNTHIIDSTYNSAYLPAQSALQLMQTLAAKSSLRAVAILGDMRELGPLAEKEHRKLAADAVKFAREVVTIGPLMKEFFEDEFKKTQKQDQKIYSFLTTREALEFITANDFEFIHEQDVILIKGSQNTLFLEVLVEHLLADRDDIQYLCRRGVFYDKIRKSLLELH